MPIQPIPPRRGVKRPASIAEPLPIKSQRESKRIYVTEHGNFVAYSERLNAMKICQDCAAKGTILSANYKDTNGQQKLCKKCASARGTHNKALGTWKPRSPCEKCATDHPEFPKEAAYMNAKGQKNKLCGPCAIKENKWEPQNLCELCDSEYDREVVYKNLEGERRKLCGPCAHKKGTWELLHPCELCPIEKKKYARYKNSEGDKNKLCADCAHAQDTWEAQNRCTECKTERGLYHSTRSLNRRVLTLWGTGTLCFWCKRDQSNWTFLRPEHREAEDKKWAENPTETYNNYLQGLRSRNKTLPHKCDGCSIHFRGQSGLKQHRTRLAFT